MRRGGPFIASWQFMAGFVSMLAALTLTVVLMAR